MRGNLAVAANMLHRRSLSVAPDAATGKSPVCFKTRRAYNRIGMAAGPSPLPGAEVCDTSRDAPFHGLGPMGFLRRPPLPTWVALVAIGIISLLANQPAEGGTIGSLGRSAEMRRAGCCCPITPAGGCCCEPSPAAPAESVVQSQAVARLSTTALRGQSDRGGGSCECRSQSPTAAIDEPDRRAPERRIDPAGADLATARRDASRTPSPFVACRAVRPSKCPLYLGLSHLLL